MKYVFGPVNSRRLGISLGIDIVPYKTCPFNCIYCECGSTTDLTDEVKEYFPFEEIVSEINQTLDKGPAIDVVTFSGSGEPTLNSRLGDIINYIKTVYPQYQIAVITNSSLLNRYDIRRRILKADIIYPSLDAVSEDVFNKIMRPLAGTKPEAIIESIVSLRKEFKGLLCVEIFIIAGINDADDELSKLKNACIKINPDEIHLNSLDRPGAEEWVKPMDELNMERVKMFFYPLPVKLVGRARSNSDITEFYSNLEKNVIDTIREDGLAAKEISGQLGIRLFDVLRVLKNLQKKGLVKKFSDINGEVYRSN